MHAATPHPSGPRSRGAVGTEEARGEPGGSSGRGMRPLCDTRCYVRCAVPATRWRPALCTAAVGDERRRRTPPRAADVDGCLTPVTLSRPPLTSRRRRPGHDAGADVPRVQQAPGVWGGPGGRRRGHEGRRGWGGWERGVRDAQDPERSTGAEDGRSTRAGGAAQTTRGDKLVIIGVGRLQKGCSNMFNGAVPGDFERCAKNFAQNF